MDFAEENYTDMVSEIIPLISKHYVEIAHYQDIRLKPDFDTYQKLSDAGILKVFTARKEKKLIGYAFFFVKTNMHYSESLQALQDILFVDKEYRGTTGARLIKFCDEELKKKGVQVVYHHVKKAHNFGRMLERLGYEEIDIVYGKRLDKWE